MARRKKSLAKSRSKSLTLPSSRFFPWTKFAPRSVFPLEKGSRAGIVVDAEGSPRLFVFDTAALLDILSTIDEKLLDRLSHDEYHSKITNPAGWLIDELESRLPVNDEYGFELRSAIDEAEKKGWISLSKIEKELALA